MLFEEFEQFDCSSIWSVRLADVIEYFELCYRSGGSNSCALPPRSRLMSATSDVYFGVMSALCVSEDIFLTKILRAKEATKNEKRVDGVAVSFSTSSGAPLAVFDGAALTDLKCAAISGLVTKYCALENARSVSIVGSGALARAQLRGILSVRSVNEVVVASRTARGLEELADICVRADPCIELTHVASVDARVMQSDIICTATNSDKPLLPAEGMLPHVHINCMGSHSKESREVSCATVQRSLVIVEDRRTALVEIGESHQNAVDIEQIVKVPIPELQNRPTLFSSTGHALLDLWTAACVMRQRKLR